MRSIKVLSLILCVVCICGIFSSCATFKDHCETTDDGFTYYFNEHVERGVYIIVEDKEILQWLTKRS